MAGLTADEYEQLRAAGLVDLYRNNKAVFTELAKKAYEYAEHAIKPSGHPVRPGDVATPLQQSLTYNEMVKKTFSKEKLRQKYWRTWFTELVLEQTWEELQKK